MFKKTKQFWDEQQAIRPNMVNKTWGLKYVKRSTTLIDNPAEEPHSSLSMISPPRDRKNFLGQ